MKTAKKKIALIYEGEKTEPMLINKMIDVFFSQSVDITTISFAAGENIYMLWNQLRMDDFDTEIIDVLKETSAHAKAKLGDLTSRDFSEVYLFFDYDGHNNNLPDEYKNEDILKEMLNTFSNETEYGKLYISYPMIESLREIEIPPEEYHTFLIPIREMKYKRYVSEISLSSTSTQLIFQDFRKIDKTKWAIACRASAKRANQIINGANEIPTYEQFINDLSQVNLYKAQSDKYVQPQNLICVLNSIPLFLLEYYNITFWNNTMKTTTNVQNG